MPASTLTRPVVVYLEDAPRRGGSGAHLRFFSNLRAWCDLGVPVHLVRLTRRENPPWEGDADLQLASSQTYPIPDSVEPESVSARLAFRLGYPTAAAVRFYFPVATTVAQALHQMAARWPNAVHVMENEWLAAGALRSGLPWIWSEHESLKDSIASMHAALSPEEQAVRRRALARERRFAAAVQRRIVDEAQGIIYISDASARTDWGRTFVRPSAYLPLSLANDEQVWSRPRVDPTAPLRLLHLGSVAHLPTYSSLRFLLTEVFPLLAATALSRITLTVVGSTPPASERVQEVLELARPFPNVRFVGFLEDIKPAYVEHDAQIIASAHGAGIRTRIVESFARGLPVLATAAAVSGSAGIVPETHYLALGSPQAAARRLHALLDDRANLITVSRAGRLLYEDQYSRRAVRDVLMKTFGPLLLGT